MRLSRHGGSASTEGSSISPHADRQNLGLGNQGASIHFGVARDFCHVLHSYIARKFLTFLTVRFKYVPTFQINIKF